MLPLQGNQKNAPTSDSRVPLLREREELLAKPKATVAFEQRREPLKQNKTDRLSAFLLLSPFLLRRKAEVGFDTFLFHLALYFPPDSTPRPRQG
jgi:hypothetical protein